MISKILVGRKTSEDVENANESSVGEGQASEICREPLQGCRLTRGRDRAFFVPNHSLQQYRFWYLTSSTNDVRHRLIVNYIYPLPFGKRRQWLSGLNVVGNAILGDWELSGIYRANSDSLFNPVLSGDNNTPIATANAANSGTISTAQDSRQMQLGLIYSFWSKGDCHIEGITKETIVSATGLGCRFHRRGLLCLVAR